jgi:transposase
MAEPLVPDELWEAVAPLLPRHKARPGKRGRPPVDDRACLTGIVFVLRSGIPWAMLPQEMGCGSGVTCWRRLRYRQRRGVWKKLLRALLQRVGQEKGIDWEHCCVDSQSFRAVFGGSSPAKTPRIGPKRARNGTCSSTARAPRWPCASPGPTATSRSKRCPSWTTSRRSAASAAGHGGSRRRCTGTGSTARRGIGGGSRSGGSQTTWRDRGRRMAAAWGRSAGSSNAPWSGSGVPAD